MNSGTRIGRYELVSPLGAGGMGEVYRAWDDRLQRAVAVKLLPSNVVADHGRLQRFVAEARIASHLNHPNVLSVFDVEIDGTPYLVSELLEGETLRQRLRRGQLTSQKTVEIGVQIARGLAAIHESGIVHRDLKPENLFLTHSSIVKILDFGLAQSFALDGGPNGKDVETVGDNLYGEATVSGTLAYLSPEQIGGGHADHRSDIFALGAILFEAVTGRSAFGRSTRALTVQAVIDIDPFVDGDIPPEVLPQPLARVIRHCLEKNPGERFQSACDVAFALEAVREDASQVKGPGSRIPSVRWKRWIATVGFCAAAATAATVATEVVDIRGGRPIPKLTVRSMLPLETGYSGDGLAIARDGSHLAYATAVDGTRQLFIWSMSGMTGRAIPGTEGATEPFFSYDGQWVGFFSAGKLKKVSIAGGAPQTICAATGGLGASWGPDGTILFTPSTTEGVWRVSAEGGEPSRVTQPDRTRREKSHRSAEWLPGGKAFIFYTHLIDMPSLDDAQIEVMELDTGRRRVLIQGGQRPQFALTGHLIYQHADSLLAVPFDVGTLSVTGPPTRLLSGIRQSSWSLRQFSLSDDGLLVYAPGSQESLKHQLVWVDRAGRIEAATDLEAEFLMPSLSADGARVAVQVVGANDSVWVHDFQRRSWTRINSSWDAVAPLWSPDGERIAVGYSKPGVLNLFWMAVDARGTEQGFESRSNIQVPTSWAPDGRSIAFTETSPKTLRDIWIMDLATGQARVFLQTPFDESDAKFSPDGRWIAYVSTENGRSEVFVRSASQQDGQWQISNDGGEWPVWSRDGGELFYHTTARSAQPGQFRAVRVNTTALFSAAEPERLFDGPRFGRYDVSPDDKRFLMVYFRPDQRTQLQVVANWFEDLKKIVPHQNGSADRRWPVLSAAWSR